MLLAAIARLSLKKDLETRVLVVPPKKLSFSHVEKLFARLKLDVKFAVVVFLQEENPEKLMNLALKFELE